MPCQVVNSQSQLQARLPALPAQMPQTQGQWTSLIQILQQWAGALQQQTHPPNVIPSQFQTFLSASSVPVLAALTAVNCTPSIDAAHPLYSQASLEVSGITSGATLALSGTPIPISGGTRWFVGFQILAPSGCTGSVSVITNGPHTITESFTVPASASFQGVWGLFDLSAFPDQQATLKFAFTSTATVNLDGLQMNAIGKVLGFLPPFHGTQMVLGATAYATNLDGVPDGSTYQRMPVVNMDASRRGLIDFTQAGHVSKNLDNIGDGTTYWRPFASYFDGAGTRRLSSSAGGIAALGSVAANSTVASVAFSWTTTSGQVVITWPSFTLLRPDGTTTTIAAGSGTTVTGLTNATVYTIYPYVVEGGTVVSFATGFSGSAGSPAICYSGGSATAAQEMNLFGNIPLNSFTVTPSAGGGGGGGDHNGCLHPSTLVETWDGRVLRARDVRHETLIGPKGPAKVTNILRQMRTEWVRVRLNNGEMCTVTPEHPFVRPDDTLIKAGAMRIGEFLKGRECYVQVRSLTLIAEPVDMVALNVEGQFYYLAGALSHNGTPKP